MFLHDLCSGLITVGVNGGVSEYRSPTLRLVLLVPNAFGLVGI